MLVLHARFHPGVGERAPAVVVGHIVWADGEGAHPIVPPSLSLMKHESPATLLSKLQYLVATASPDSFKRLQALHSLFWSFVDVSPVLPDRGSS